MLTLSQTTQLLRSRTGRLALTYLAIIVGMTVLFSVIIYAIASSQFERGQPPDRIFDSSFYHNQISTWLDERAATARLNLILSLVLLNVVTIIGGAFFSYYLARKTLLPIETAMEAQSRFVSDASHELRTPLTALQTTNEVALRKKKLTLDEAKELLQHNVTETMKLRTLSDALLGLMKGENADTAKETFLLSDALQPVFETLVPNAQQKDIAISDEVPPLSLYANKAAVSQIVKIFLDNAITYAPKNSVVKVSAEQHIQEVVISVRDSGEGIAKKYHERIFERFFRIDEARSRHQVDGGNGLGLAIARTLSERHGYHLSLESKPEKGSTFYLHIRTWGESESSAAAQE